MKLFRLLRLSERQLEKLSDILSDAGLVALASVVLPALLDKFSVITIILGLIVTFTCWVASLSLRK